jgi:RNAse (barnase) inhibitor barstar
MPLEMLAELIEENRGGVWYLPEPVDAASVQKLAKRNDFAYFHIDGKNITRKEQLLNQIATTLKFPKDFGHNWDALEECLTDMDWVDADGYILYYEHIDTLQAAGEQLETFVEILRDAVQSWKEDDTAMIVLLTGGKAPKGVKRLRKEAEAD